MQYNLTIPEDTNEKQEKELLVDSFITKNSQKNKQCDKILEKIDQEMAKINELKLSSSQYNNTATSKNDQNYLHTINKTQQDTRSTPSNISPFLSKSKDFKKTISCIIHH